MEKMIVIDNGRIIDAEFEISSGYYGFRDRRTGDWFYESQVKDYKNIDWEKRRYETAKDLMVKSYPNNEDHIELCAALAVRSADILIKELKKQLGCE